MCFATSRMGQRCTESISLADRTASGQIIFENIEETIDSSKLPFLCLINHCAALLTQSFLFQLQRNTDWEAAAGLLKGIHETIVRHPYVLHWQQIKTLFNTVQNLIVNEPGSTTEGVSSGAGTAIITQNPPPFFCSTVVRLISMQLISPIQYYSLEHICGGSAEFPSQEKAEGFLMHLLMPLCLKVCSGRGVSDVGMLKQSDISFLVAATLNAMSPPAGRTGQIGNSNNRTGGDLRAGSLTFTGSRDAKRPARISGSLYQAAFLCKFFFCSRNERATDSFPYPFCSITNFVHLL